MRVNLNNSERSYLVRSIFSQVACRYDLMNHVLSLGRDIYWRRQAADRVQMLSTGRILDLASGTGDLALALARRHQKAKVTAIDFTPAMLDYAKEKITSAGKHEQISQSAADAMKSPFSDNSFDGATIAFGIRNIPDRSKALKEMLRILTPGGRAVVLELSFPRSSLIRRFYKTYLTKLIPALGGRITGNRLAYQYLADSILDFPLPEDFQAMMAEAGFIHTGFKKLTMGIAVLYWGEKEG